MKSNKAYHYFFKYSLLGVSVLLTVVAVVSWIAPESTVNGAPGTRDVWTTLVFVLIAILAFLMFLLIRKNFAIVKLGNQTIEIKRNGQARTIAWSEVEEVSLIQFIYPPLYTLRIKDSDEKIWFNTQSNYINVNGFIIDSSDMGSLIKRKKKELEI